MSEKKYFAVFGDTHGHIRLMFRLCQLWQMHNRVYLDGIFQCGDFGYFPDTKNLDKATKAYEKKDPEELGFKYFTKPLPKIIDKNIERLLCGADIGYENVRCPVYFCHGNHEDFKALSAEVGNANIKAVDYYNRLFWIRPGYIHDTHGVKIAAIGGGAESVEISENDTGQGEPWKWVNAAECSSLEKSKFHILLSHVSPMGLTGESGNWGSASLRKLIDNAQPSYNFYAHHKNKIEPASIGRTKCFWLNDVNFNRVKTGTKMPLEKGCMGILSWKDEYDHEFKIIEDKWFNEVNYINWCWK